MGAPARLGVAGVVVGVAQYAARERAGVLAVFHQNIAVDDRRHDALGGLLDAFGAGREVVQYKAGVIRLPVVALY